MRKWMGLDYNGSELQGTHPKSLIFTTGWIQIVANRMAYMTTSLHCCQVISKDFTLFLDIKGIKEIHPQVKVVMTQRSSTVG